MTALQIVAVVAACVFTGAVLFGVIEAFMQRRRR